MKQLINIASLIMFAAPLLAPAPAFAKNLEIGLDGLFATRYEYTSGIDRLYQPHIEENPMDLLITRLRAKGASPNFVDNVQSRESFELIRFLFDPTEDQTGIDGHHFSVYLIGGISLAYADYFDFYLSLQSNELSEDTTTDQYSRDDAETWMLEVGLNFIRELSLNITPLGVSDLSLSIGRRFYNLGSGHIAYNYYNGGRASFALDSVIDQLRDVPVDIYLAGAKVDRLMFFDPDSRAFFVGGGLKVYPDFFDWIDLYYYYFRENENFFGDLLEDQFFYTLLNGLNRKTTAEIDVLVDRLLAVESSGPGQMQKVDQGTE